MRFLAFTAWIVLFCAPAVARPPSVPEPDAPLYSRLGEFVVGRATVPLTGARPSKLIIWYPATASKVASPEPYRWTIRPAPPLVPRLITYEAIATVDTPPIAGRFPLVVLSHGFGGSPQHLSYLGENLASKGYIVVGIDHADASYRDATDFQRAFAQAVQHRARDQQRVIEAFVEGKVGVPARITGSTDRTRVAIIGYSMGGFGALATAGAGYDPKSMVITNQPAGTLTEQLEGRAHNPRIKAVVAIAPWGAQAPFRSWSPIGTGIMKTPMLLVSGDQDDISNHADGANWIFDHATASNRWMLVYKNARHNIGGNPAPAELADGPGYWMHFEEPVWRLQRLNALNQHFITAFLDWQVKGDTTRAAAFIAPVAGSDWPGFAPRSSLGFDLLRRSAAR